MLRLHVEGVFDEPKGGSPFGEVSISNAAFDGAFADHDNTFTLLNVAGEPNDDGDRRARAGGRRVPHRGGADA